MEIKPIAQLIAFMLFVSFVIQFVRHCWQTVSLRYSCVTVSD